MSDAVQAALRGCIEELFGAGTRLSRATLLGGGASMEAWAVDAETSRGPVPLLVRRAAGGRIYRDALSLSQEFRLLEAAWEAGVRVPRPYRHFPDVGGREAFAMERLPGETVGRRIVQRPELEAARGSLPGQMAEQLARIHSLDPSRLEFLPGARDAEPLRRSLDVLQGQLDEVGEPHPAIELALLRLRRDLPRGAGAPRAVCHGDFRIGNLMVGEAGLTGVLDWEFAHVGDPREDLAWPMVRAWRFGREPLRLGGIATPEAFLERYAQLTGLRTTREELRVFELLGNVRWAIGALSQGLRGERLAEIGEMHRAGIVGVSDDGRPVIDAALMRRALEYSSMFGLPVIAHEEEPHLAAGGAMNEGVTALRLGLRGIPAAAEEVMIARDLALARLTGGRLHVAHVSTRGAVALLREAKAQGLPVTAEVTPHHLFLTEEAVEGYGTNAKMAPPLRTRADVAALRAALADGTIDAIATDHAPHHHDEKDVEFDLAANGVVGLETALPLALRLVAEGVLDLPTLVARMTVGPARILGLPAGTLAPGAAADLTLVDPERRWRVEARAFRSKGRNTPFEGWDMTGRAVAVLVGGRLVHDERPATAPALRSAS